MNDPALDAPDQPRPDRPRADQPRADLPRGDAGAGTGPTTAEPVDAARVRRFDEVWDRHVGAVYAFAARRVGADRAADVVADTFLVVWRRLDEGLAMERPWLYGVARNVLRQQERSTSRIERLHGAVAPHPPAPSAEDAALTRHRVQEALASLTDLDAEIVLLSEWEGLSSREIGAVVGLGAAAVRMRLSRAKRSLAATRTEEARP